MASNPAQSTPARPTQGVISEAWALYKNHWQHLLGIALVVYLILAVLSLVLAATLAWVGTILAALLGLVGVYWLQGALVRAVEDVRDGRVDLSMGETFSGVQPFIGRITGASILASLAIFVGLFLLLAPGLFLLTIWSVLVPVIVLENRSMMGAFGRSRELVRGWGWSVFGLIVLTYLILMVAGIVIGLLTTPFGETAGSFLSNLISGTVTGPFVAATWTLLYYRLSALERPLTDLGGPVGFEEPQGPPLPHPG
ncbi:MAG: hypothetical protein ABR592_00930 [Nitriliruptorales bacterium]